MEPVRTFDYVEDGGFLIRCKDGGVLGVTAEQAEVVQRRCDFIRNCFRHGTTEESNRTIDKPDWTLAIARHLVEALTKGETTVRTLPLYFDLMAASDQAVVDLRLCNMVDYTETISTEAAHMFADLVDPAMYCFAFRGSVSTEEWNRLLETGILLTRPGTNYVCRLHTDQPAQDGQHVAKRNLDNRPSHFVVHSRQTVKALMKLQTVLSGHGSSGRSVNEEKFTLYFETERAMPEDHHELIDRLAGGETYVRTCPDTVDTTQGYTISGSFDLLRRALLPLFDGSTADGSASASAAAVASLRTAAVLATATQGRRDAVDSPEGGTGRSSCDELSGRDDTEKTEVGADGSGDRYCTIRVDNPTPDTLCRFVNACKGAEDVPGSLGMDTVCNRYFCRKTLRDTMSVLEHMSDYSRRSDVSPDFVVLQLSSEKAVV